MNHFFFLSTIVQFPKKPIDNEWIIIIIELNKPLLWLEADCLQYPQLLDPDALNCSTMECCIFNWYSDDCLCKTRTSQVKHKTKHYTLLHKGFDTHVYHMTCTANIININWLFRKNWFMLKLGTGLLFEYPIM